MKKPQCKDTCVKTVCQAFYRQYMLSPEEHTSELQSPKSISYAVFCLKKKKKKKKKNKRATKKE